MRGQGMILNGPGSTGLVCGLVCLKVCQRASVHADSARANTLGHRYVNQILGGRQNVERQPVRHR